jgi:hypothetical protein
MRKPEEIKADNYWWCPNCHDEVDPHNVTYQEIHETCGYRVQWIENIPIDDLEKMCQAWKEGRCVVLPCKVGDTVYWVCKGRIIPCRVEGLKKENGAEFIKAHGDLYEEGRSFHLNDWVSDREDMGKTVFLTRAEAEACTEGGRQCLN